MAVGQTGAMRLEQARRMLESAGVAGATVEAAGHESDIAAIVAPVTQLPRLQELAPALKALGFRYVALDLGAGGAEQDTAPRPVDEPSREMS
jgi:hypothetical protein